MAKLNIDIVTAERTVFCGQADVVIAPGASGELSVLPSHAPLLTSLQPGAVIVRNEGNETHMAVSGGFLEVAGNHVIILADTAEQAEEIDIARAEAARQRALQLLANRREAPGPELAAAAAALRRSQVRLKVGRRRRTERVAPGQH